MRIREKCLWLPDCPKCGSLRWVRAWGEMWQCTICNYVLRRDQRDDRASRLRSAAEVVRVGWEQAMKDEIKPLSKLWDDIDAK